MFAIYHSPFVAHCPVFGFFHRLPQPLPLPVHIPKEKEDHLGITILNLINFSVYLGYAILFTNPIYGYFALDKVRYIFKLYFERENVTVYFRPLSIDDPFVQYPLSPPSAPV